MNHIHRTSLYAVFSLMLVGSLLGAVPKEVLAASISISASPNPTYTNSMTPLSWSASDAAGVTQCGISGGGFGQTVFTGNQANVSGSTYVQPSQNTTYTITCTYGAGQSMSASVLLTTQCPSGGNSPATCANIPVTIAFAGLTSDSGPSLSITPGSTITMTGTVRNTTLHPDGTTYNAFVNTFQIALADQSTVVESIDMSAAPLAPNSLINYSRTSSYNFPSAGTYYYRLCADTRIGSYPWNDVLETDEANNCSGWTTVTVAAPLIPDVTPSNASGPTSLIVGQTGTWSATTYNVGTGGTGVNVPVAFAIDNADHSVRTTVLYTSTGPIAAGGSAVTSGSYAFSTPGTYWIIPCSDVASGWVGTFNESNEGNNCGSAWVAINVYAVPTAAISVSPNSIAYGGSSTISWSSSAATSCTGSGFNTGGATSGSVAVSATVTTTYYVSCSGPGGTSPTASATLTVGPQLFADLTPGSAATYYVAYGQALTVSGTVSNIGNGSTGASFNNMFVTNLNAQGTAWNTQVTASPASGNLAPGGSASFSYTFPASTWSAPGTYAYAYCVDYNGSWAQLITESNENNNCVGANVVVTIPNLTATVGSATTIIANASGTLGGTVQNTGTGSSGSAVQNIVQICDSGCSTYNQYNAVSTASAVAAGGSQAVSRSVTAPSTAGTYYYRLCANVNATFTAYPIVESDYNNNCSAWQTLTVSPAIPSAPTGLTATCNVTGTAVTLSWTPTSGATYYNPRMYAPTAAQCVAAGWQVWTGDNLTCIPNPDSWTGTTITNFPITPGQNYSWWVHAANGTGTGAATSGSFTCAGAADLTAGSVTPTTATAGTPRTFSSTATNNGNAASGSFPMLFQVSQTGALVNSSYVSAIPAGGSSVATASYTFPSAGTYQVRACANNNTSWVNIVTESNYANNCGPWTDVVVAAATPPSVSCTVDQQSVPVGGFVNYTATLANGGTSPYTWTASDGASVGSASTATRSFPAPGNYAMTVKGSNTSAANCPMVSVNATWCTTATPALSITASSARVKSGSTVTLSWSASGINGQNASCTVTGPNVSWSSAVSASPSCSVPNGSATPTITTQSTYTLTCGSESKSVTVNVIPNFTEF